MSTARIADIRRSYQRINAELVRDAATLPASILAGALQDAEVSVEEEVR